MREAHRTKRTSHLLWRWRSNPLRRHDDVVEAWIGLAVWTVIALGGAFVGTLTAHAADESFTQQRATRHAVRAVLVESTADATQSAAATFDDRVKAKVRWTASDGSTRTGRTVVDTGQTAGSKVVIWADDKGRLTREPQSATDAAIGAAFLGTLAALALGGLAYGAGRAARWRLDQRRIAQWAREWEQVGPQWRRKTT
ncbi:hypothetical protein ACFYO0_40780 [Streptomyces sp. NPDC006365]|uniref:Rv1733c family protein n=1 Tax=Streptomyces sp. NPDC006365 TaxID=3364744 RepID=UPI00367715C9